MKDTHIAHYAQINKFSNYHGFYDFIVLKYPKWKRFAEIGVWKGQAVVHLANLIQARTNAKVYAIDLFDDLWKYKDYAERYKGYHIRHIYEMYQYNIEQANVGDIIEDVKGLSCEVVEQFKDRYFDFVFIDGDHEYEAVKQDITDWMPKVKHGGILAGHDHTKSQQGVIKAICEIIPNHKHYSGYVWYQEI